MESPAPTPESPCDKLDDAIRLLRRPAVLLLQLFEALSNPTGQGKALADFGSRYEADFWAGLRDATRDILRASEDVQQNADSLRSSAGVEAPAERKGKAINGHETRPAAGIATDLARAALTVDLGRIIEDHQEGWEALVDAVRTEKFPGDAHALAADAHLDLYSKLIMTLPVEHRREFKRLSESRIIDEIIERHAAFELGRQIERQAIEARR